MYAADDDTAAADTLLPAKSNTARRRLVRDFKALSRDPPSGVSGAPCPDNILLWNAVIFGPRERHIYTAVLLSCEDEVGVLTPPVRALIQAETPFEDGTFRLALTFEETYPNRPPTVKFM